MEPVLVPQSSSKAIPEDYQEDNDKTEFDPLCTSNFISCMSGFH